MLTQRGTVVVDTGCGGQRTGLGNLQRQRKQQRDTARSNSSWAQRLQPQQSPAIFKLKSTMPMRTRL